jgi:hypothetical protein
VGKGREVGSWVVGDEEEAVGAVGFAVDQQAGRGCCKPVETGIGVGVGEGEGAGPENSVLGLLETYWFGIWGCESLAGCNSVERAFGSTQSDDKVEREKVHGFRVCVDEGCLDVDKLPSKNGIRLNVPCSISSSNNFK